MSGYVRIHRALIEHPAFRTDAEAMAFAWLVAKASWRSIRIRYKGHGVCLERGQLAISIREFAVAMDRDKAWIERLLKRLKSEAMVETAAEAGVTVVTICNYDKYQADCSEPETARETVRETRARQTRDTEQEGNKGKKEKKALPDWLPLDEWAAFRKMRKAMRVPFTEEAESGIIADLERLIGEGHCPKKVLLKAVKRGWRGVFGDEDTKVPFAKAAAVELSPEEVERRAGDFERWGMNDEAKEVRRKYAAPIGELVSKITRAA